MSDGGTPSLARIARRAALVALLAVIGAVVYYSAFRRSGSSEVAPDSTPTADRKVDRKEDIKHLEYKEGDVWLDVRGDRFFLGEDGLNHLEGRIEIIDRSRGSGAEMIITAERVSFDDDLTLFTFKDGVEFRDGDAALKSEVFIYEKKRGVLRTVRKTAFSSSRMIGSAASFLYNIEEGRLRMTGGFHLEMGIEENSGDAVVLRGRELDYRMDPRLGSARSLVTVEGSRFRGKSEALSFRLTEKEESLSELTLSGRARCLFLEPGRDSEAAADTSLEAEVIRIQPLSEEAEVSVVEAHGKCRMIIRFNPERDAAAEGDEVRLVLAADGRLRNLELSAPARLDLVEGEGGKRTIAGWRILYDGEAEALDVMGRKGDPVRMESKGWEIEAGSLSLKTDEEDFRASGGVKGIFGPRNPETAIGFFGPGKSVFFTCGELTGSRDPTRFNFSRNVRLWQEKEYIEADEIGYDEDAEEFCGSGGVETAVFEAEAGSRGGRLDIGGERMEFSSAAGEVFFEGRAFLRRGDVRLSSETLRIALREDGRDVESLAARGSVVIRQGLMEGRGGASFYDLDEETLVLTGHPVLIESGKGSARGDKLTFRLADDRILIENKGQERSVAVIKS